LPGYDIPSFWPSMGDARAADVLTQRPRPSPRAWVCKGEDWPRRRPCVRLLDRLILVAASAHLTAAVTEVLQAAYADLQQRSAAEASAPTSSFRTLSCAKPKHVESETDWHALSALTRLRSGTFLASLTGAGPPRFATMVLGSAGDALPPTAGKSGQQRGKSGSAPSLAASLSAAASMAAHTLRAGDGGVERDAVWFAYYALTVETYGPSVRATINVL